jgi:hypothetical protein
MLSNIRIQCTDVFRCILLSPSLLWDKIWCISFQKKLFGDTFSTVSNKRIETISELLSFGIGEIPTKSNKNISGMREEKFYLYGCVSSTVKIETHIRKLLYNIPTPSEVIS